MIVALFKIAVIIEQGITENDMYCVIKTKMTKFKYGNKSAFSTVYCCFETHPFLHADIFKLA